MGLETPKKSVNLQMPLVKGIKQLGHLYNTGGSLQLQKSATKRRR